MPPGLKQITRAAVRLAEHRQGDGAIAGVFFGVAAADRRVHPARRVHRRAAPPARPDRRRHRPTRAGCATRSRQRGRQPIDRTEDPAAATSARSTTSSPTTPRRVGDTDLGTANAGKHHQGENMRSTAMGHSARSRPGGLGRRRRLRQRRQGHRATTAAGADDDGGRGDAPRRSGDDRRRRRPPRPAARRRPPASAATTGGASTTPATPAAAARGAVEPGSKSPPPAGVGLIDGVYKGTAGFELDPADCPEDWDPKQGITDTEINLFQSLPTSGPLAGFGLLADGAKSYFDYINANGGIDGRKIIARRQGRRLRSRTRPRPTSTRRSAPNKYAGVHHVLGTPNNLADLGRDQRRVHAAAAQRHRRRAVG